MSDRGEDIANRIIGAGIVATREEDGYLRIEWEHRGTDDDSGCALVPLAAFCFCVSESMCADCWTRVEEQRGTTEAAQPRPQNLAVQQTEAHGIPEKSAPQASDRSEV